MTTRKEIRDELTALVRGADPELTVINAQAIYDLDARLPLAAVEIESVEITRDMSGGESYVASLQVQVSAGQDVDECDALVDTIKDAIQAGAPGRYAPQSLAYDQLVEDNYVVCTINYDVWYTS